MKKIISSLLAGLFTITMLTGCGAEKTDQPAATPKPATTKSTELTPMRIGYQAIPNTETIAKAMGWHESTIPGAQVEWLTFDSGRDVNTALASGSIDVGLLGSTLVANGLSKNLDYQVIWLSDVIGANEALVVKKDAGITSPADLKGKTIAVTFGSTTQYTLLGALKTNNIDPQDVNIVDLQPAEMLAAWQRGDIDGGYVWHPTLQAMIDQDGKVLLDSGDLVDKGIVTADVLVVRNEFAKAHPDMVTAYIKSQIRAAEFYGKDQQKAVQAVARELGIKNQEAQKMMKELIWLSAAEQASDSYLGSKPGTGEFSSVLADTAKFLKDQGLIDETAKPEVFQQAVNPHFILQAQSK